MKLLKNPFACSICRETFSVPISLQKHVRNKHITQNVEPRIQNPSERNHSMQHVEVKGKENQFIKVSTEIESQVQNAFLSTEKKKIEDLRTVDNSSKIKPHGLEHPHQ